MVDATESAYCTVNIASLPSSRHRCADRATFVAQMEEVVVTARLKYIQFESKFNSRPYLILVAATESAYCTVNTARLLSSRHCCADRAAFVAQMEEVVVTARRQQLSLQNVDVAKLLSDVFAVLLRHQV